MCSFAKIKIGCTCGTKKPVSLQREEPLLWEVWDGGLCRVSGARRRKGGDFPAEWTLNGAGVHFPAGPPGGPHPAPQPRCQGTSSLCPRRCAWNLRGKEWHTKVPGKCPPFPAEVELPLGCVFLAPRPVARCSPALLARTGELFPLQRKPGAVTAGPSAVPASPQDGEHGGEARPRGIPHLIPFPAPPWPWMRCSPVGETLRKGARGVCQHPALRCTHACAGHVHTPAGVTHPLERGHACGAGVPHACAGTHGAALAGVAVTAVSTDGHSPQVRTRRLQTRSRRAHPGRCPAPAAVGIP